MEHALTSFIALARRAADAAYRNKKRFYFAAGLFLVLLGSNALYRSAVSDPPRTDLPVFLRAAEAVVQGENIYDVKTVRQWNYVYPPLLAVLLVPFTSLPLAVNAVLWYLLSALSLCGGFVLCIRMAKDPREGFIAALIAFVLCLPAFLNTLVRGQMGVLSLFLAFLVFRLHQKKRDVLCGLALALAVTLKPTPLAPVIFFFAALQKWRTCFAFAAGGILFVFLLPAAGLGFERNVQSVLNYLALVTHAVSEHGHQGILWQQLVTPFAEDNQSVYAALTRIFWPSEQAMIAGSNEVIRQGVRFAGLAALILLGFITFRNRKDEGTGSLARYAAFGSVMLFFSPVTEHHHYAMMALPYYAGLRLAAETGGGRKIMLEAGITLAAFSYLFGLVLEELSFWGVPVWGNLLYCGLLAAAAAGAPVKEAHTARPHS